MVGAMGTRCVARGRSLGRGVFESDPCCKSLSRKPRGPPVLEGCRRRQKLASIQPELHAGNNSQAIQPRIAGPNRACSTVHSSNVAWGASAASTLTRISPKRKGRVKEARRKVRVPGPQ